MGYTVSATASAYPLTYDNGPRVNNKSDLLYFSEQWTTLYKATNNEYSLNACIKAFVSKDDLIYVTRYDIYQDNVKVGETTNANFTLDGLFPGEYEFCVKAIYSNGEESATVCKVTVCNEVCNPVTNLNVVYSATCDTATLTWTKPTTAFPVKYNVYRGETEIASLIEETTCVDTDFDNVAGHTWSVKTVCLTMESNNVNKSAAACIDCKPVSNMFVTFSEECDKASIQWTAPPVAYPVKYNVYSDGTEIAPLIDETNYTDENFDNSVEHTWSVKTVCSSLLSTPVDFQRICLGIADNIRNLSIFPNPASQTVTIQVEKFQKVEIYNTVGQLVEMTNNSNIDVSNYSLGLYIFKVFDTDNNFAIRKVTVQR
jgi:hypothetical protein